MLVPGLLLGGAKIQDSKKSLEDAVELAEDADGVVAIVGLNDVWETEGIDRTNLALPGRTDELIARVAAVNAKTVVVTLAVCYRLVVDIYMEICWRIDDSR